MDPDLLIELHPEAFHVTEGGAWESIRRNGLLSTAALLDRLRIFGEERESIESQIRPDSVELSGDGLGRIVIRDNRPLREHILARCLETSVPEWCRLLNRRVFLWTTERRARRHLGARGHRDGPRDLIVLDTARLLERHLEEITLCAFNSGSALYPNAPTRGRASFVTVHDFPYDAWRSRRAAREVVVEICVDRHIPDIEHLVRRVERIAPGRLGRRGTS